MSVRQREKKKQNRMRGREIREFGDLGSHVVELYSTVLDFDWGKLSEPSSAEAGWGLDGSLSLCTLGPAGND